MLSLAAGCRRCRRCICAYPVWPHCVYVMLLLYTCRRCHHLSEFMSLLQPRLNGRAQDRKFFFHRPTRGFHLSIKLFSSAVNIFVSSFVRSFVRLHVRHLRRCLTIYWQCRAGASERNFVALIEATIQLPALCTAQKSSAHLSISIPLALLFPPFLLMHMQQAKLIS